MAITERRNLESPVGTPSCMKLLVLLVAAAGCSSKSTKVDGAVMAGQSGQAGGTSAAQSASGGNQGSSSPGIGGVDAGTASLGGAGGIQASEVGGNSTTGYGGATAIGSGGTPGGTAGGTNSVGSGGTVGLGGAGGVISLTTGGGSSGGSGGLGGSAGGGSGGTAGGESGSTAGAGSGGTTGGGSGGTAGAGSGGIGGSSIVTGGDAGAASSDYCSGDRNKLSYQGQDLSPAATNCPSAIVMDCCKGLGVNLHTLAQLGFDLDLDITVQAGSTPPGQYPVGPTVDFSAPFRNVTIRKYGVASTTEPPLPMSGTVTTSGIPSGVTAQDMGLCLETDSASSPSAVIRLYVPHVIIIPGGLRSQFQIFRLADQSITPEQAQAQSLNSLALAATPLLDLGSIYYVEQSTGNIGTPNASTIGNSLRNPSSVVPLAGLPFVVKVDDVPIYLGTFFRLVSSMIPVGPVIIVDNITDDLVPISAPKRAGNDPRFDLSIVQVLTDTGKLVP
jgi:hypothetical protein